MKKLLIASILGLTCAQATAATYDINLSGLFLCANNGGASGDCNNFGDYQPTDSVDLVGTISLNTTGTGLTDDAVTDWSVQFIGPENGPSDIFTPANTAPDPGTYGISTAWVFDSTNGIDVSATPTELTISMTAGANNTTGQFSFSTQGSVDLGGGFIVNFPLDQLLFQTTTNGAGETSFTASATNRDILISGNNLLQYDTGSEDLSGANLGGSGFSFSSDAVIGPGTVTYTFPVSTAVPIPAAAWLFGLGLLTLARQAFRS